MKKYLFSILFTVLSFTVSNARPKVALVLGGGGAKGAAEVGVLKYIEKSGVPIDMIVGTSIGSIVGGLYSVGYRSQQLDELFRSQEWINLLTDRSQSYRSQMFKREDGVTYVFGFPISIGRKKQTDSLGIKGFGAVRGDSIVSYLEQLTDCRDSISFDNLPIPFRCVAVDMKSMSDVVLSQGRLPLAMRASMAIPFVFRPIIIEGTQMVDGGVLNNLPVDVARRMGADYVIAIDLTQNKHEDFDGLLPDIPFVKNRWLNWILRRPDLERYHANVADADVYISPELENCSAMSFNRSKIDYMISQGEKAGKSAYKQLTKLKKKLK